MKTLVSLLIAGALSTTGARSRGAADFSQCRRKREYRRDSACALSAFEQETEWGAANRGDAESERRDPAASPPALPEATSGRAIQQTERYRSHQTVARVIQGRRFIPNGAVLQARGCPMAGRRIIRKGG